MITSEDVRRVTFDRIMRGYRCEDVDDYLKQVADAMDALAAEREDMQKKVMVLAQRIDQYRADESTLSTTMLNAQRLGENVIKEAKQKAAEILREANIRAEDREQRARDEVALCQQEVVTLHREADGFKKKLQKMYKEHIELISKLPSYVEEPAEEEPAPVDEALPAVAEPLPDTEPQPEAPGETAAPESQEYEQQQFDAQAGTTYYRPEAAPEGETVDTVEFALEASVDTDDYAAAPRPEPAPTAGPAGETRYVPGAGLYDLPETDVKDGLNGFSGVDFDS